MIQSFACRDSQDVYEGRACTRFVNILRVLRRKLALLDTATKLNDLRAPPGNHLEQLARDRVGQHSIKVNDQFRLCFTWTDAGPINVECVDYH